MTYRNPVRIRVEQVTTVKFQAHDDAKHEVFRAKMRETPWLKNLNETVSVYDDGPLQKLSVAKERSGLKREYWTGVVSQTSLKTKTRLQVWRVLEGDLDEPHLEDAAADEEPLAAPPSQRLLALTGIFPRCDYHEKGFPEWLATEGLLRGPNEESLYFAKRAYDWMRTNIRYDGRLPYPSSALAVAKCGYGECGRQSELCTAILRSQGIACQEYYGLVKGDTPDKPGTHCWADFYAENVGWVPIDTAGACFGDYSYRRVPFHDCEYPTNHTVFSTLNNCEEEMEIWVTAGRVFSSGLTSNPTEENKNWLWIV